jgi:predicted permease
MSWFDGARARLRLLLARRAAEERMDEEIRFHVEMETDRLVREEGLEPAEARRRALVAFGGVEKCKEELRDGRGLAWLGGLSLDLKLGFRMLVKYPVLTVASVLALAVAFTLAAAWFEFSTDMTLPRVPLEEGDRIVGVRNRDLATADRDYSSEPRSLHDFELWRDELRSIQDLAAYSRIAYTATTDDGRYAALEGVRTTPSLFRVARVAPLIGRALIDDDLRPEAPPVVVLGHSAWIRLFDGDRSALGKTVRLGAEYATVVGVMPEGFAFPVSEEFWTPLRERAIDYARREGPRIAMIGRLAPGYTLEQAQAELTMIGERTAAAYPDTHEHLRPEVRRFPWGNEMAAITALLNIPFILLLVVVAANVATLLIARTAARESEIALRSALGAGRRRILLQLVAEALVTTSLAGALGLAVARWGLGWGMDLFWEVQQSRPPFWFDPGLSASTVLYVGALAVLGALVVGGIPGLRATHRRIWTRLPQPGAAGEGMRFGVLATGVIIAQVALCVAFIPVAVRAAQEQLRDPKGGDFPAEAFLTGRLTRQPPFAPRASGGPDEARRTAELFDEAHRRLAAEPGVVVATRANRIPGFNHPVAAIELDGDSARILRVRGLSVAPNFFEVMGARIVAGRAFTDGDVAASGDVAIVDEAWAAEAFAGRSPIGRRIRYPTRDGEAGSRVYEIVGVVAGLERAIGPGEKVAVYHPLKPEEHAGVQFYLRTAGPPEALVPRVVDLAPAMDPSLGVSEVMPLDDVWRPVQRSDAIFTVVVVVVVAIILLFALIGIYALTSFTVTRRTREIGIRATLGAGPGRILLTLFSRVLIQIGAGIVLGATLVSLTVARDPAGLRLVGGVAASMLVVGLAGCAVPAIRALRIHPVEALRTE